MSLTLEPQDGFSLHKRTQRSHEVFSSAALVSSAKDACSLHRKKAAAHRQTICHTTRREHVITMSLHAFAVQYMCIYILYIYHASHKDSTHSTRKHDDKNGAAWLWPHSTKRMHRLKIPRYSKIFQGLHSELGLVQRMLQQSAAIQHTSWVI